MQPLPYYIWYSAKFDEGTFDRYWIIKCLMETIWWMITVYKYCSVLKIIDGLNFDCLTGMSKVSKFPKLKID